jgi:hypothetical protein
VIIDPISAVVGGVSAGLGVLQGMAGDAARQQDYVNQTAYQNATSKFNRWQAGLNAQIQDLNSQYGYWAETVNFNQQLAYTSQLRSYDLAQEIAQADRVAQTRTGAGTDYLVNSQALSERFAEEGMARAVGMQQYTYRMLQQSSAFQAMAGEGNSTDRIVNNFARQAGDYETLQQINTKLAERQYTRQQLSQITDYLSKYNSQQFFEAQERMDPIMPFPPLPTMVMPPPPSMTGAAPQSNGFLNVGSAVLGGFNTYLSTAAAIKKL